MKSLGKFALVTALGVSALAFTAVRASADIACTGDVCWHTHTVYDYPPEAHVVIHDDSWHWGPEAHYVFREHEGRGYWRGDDWVDW
ncbi:MAG TPA: hypothetical protein VKV77_03535 [Methylovirgula sp.]|nr:hypothetical protein [Methylovirgula sp.]